MISHTADGRQESVFFQTTLTGGVSTSCILTLTPIPQGRQKRISLLSSESTGSQRHRLCSNNPGVISITLILLVERLSQHDLHGCNQQAKDGDIFGDVYPSSPSPSPNSSIFSFQNIDPQKQSASHPTS